LEPGSVVTWTGVEMGALMHHAGSAQAGHTRGTLAYRLVRTMVRVLLWLFYRRIDVVGRERIPPDGGVIVAANHHNSVVVALSCACWARYPSTAASRPATIRGKNEAMFTAAIDALRAGGMILIFPEGRTQPQPILLPLRTGAARLALGAERAPGGPCPVTLLPVGFRPLKGLPPPDGFACGPPRESAP